MKHQNTIAFTILLGLLWFAGSAGADPTNDAVSKVQEKFQATFSQMHLIDFRESQIPGVYEITNPDQIIYYYPEKELLIFGAFYSKDGRNLTQERIEQVKGARFEKLDLSSAIVIGHGDKEIVEFTDPDCPYCKRYDQWARTNNVKRRVIFMPMEQLHPEAQKKALHILCSPDKELAFREIYDNKVGYESMVDCPDGHVVLEQHRLVSSQFGVQGTPTLAWKGPGGTVNVVTGFVKERIAQFINQPLGEKSK